MEGIFVFSFPEQERNRSRKPIPIAAKAIEYFDKQEPVEEVTTPVFRNDVPDRTKSAKDKRSFALAPYQRKNTERRLKSAVLCITGFSTTDRETSRIDSSTPVSSTTSTISQFQDTARPLSSSVHRAESLFEKPVWEHPALKEIKEDDYLEIGCAEESITTMNPLVKSKDSYEKALKVYGWRMEVPRDPLYLKKPYLPKRRSYSVDISLEPSLPLPPKMRVSKAETFFQPTVKIMPLSFTVSPDFSSEAFVAKQNDLRRSGNWNYGTRRYAFLY
ncbi:hypothetical protein T265_08667 [Opisthorchis viverrini]|uniref:Uncharacterized protein n=1 Tax=Opisthorchis viverrini TaxID=6198 RepID=A0A074ZCT8_OPIVI|nr:hypothetical protein T265_08667 [Opisthorchis viverrini]KER23447.1 hypothetical protein T265_08667 [Opisthorchis viverrini]